MDMRLEHINRQANARAASSSWDDADARIVKLIRWPHALMERIPDIHLYAR